MTLRPGSCDSMVLQPRQAGEILSETQWGRKFSVPEDIDGWKPYVLDVLKNLKNADKSNWHHRILARVSPLGKGIIANEALANSRERRHVCITRARKTRPVLLQRKTS